MAGPLGELSPEKLNSPSIPTHDNDMSWHDPPSSPFVSNVEIDQENMAPPEAATSTPIKSHNDTCEPQSAFKLASPSKSQEPLKQRSPAKQQSPLKPLLDGFEEPSLHQSFGERRSPKKSSPVKGVAMERPGSAMSDNSHMDLSPAKVNATPSQQTSRTTTSPKHSISENFSSSVKRAKTQHETSLRDNEGLTVAIKMMEETHTERRERSSSIHTERALADLDDFNEMEDTDFNADGPDNTSLTVDDTCFSTFSEMANLDMTKFAFLKKSPTKAGSMDQATPRARALTTPSTVRSTIRRADRTPSPTPRASRTEQANAGDTTNLLLDFTAQIEAFSAYSNRSPTRQNRSPGKSTTEPNLLSYIQNQRSPAKGSSYVPSTPTQNRPLINLLDFELPPPPTPRSIPTVTIRELESLKSSFQSQISSLTASLSGKEAEVESLVRAVSDAERRVGETQELLRDERSAREHAEAQMVDWKNKGEEVQKLLQDVQAELARNDSEREALLARLAEVEKRAEDAEQRASEFETRLIEAESKNVDMTTFINPDEEAGENKKIYSELECQAAIADKVQEVARELHAAYKAKHEKKIKALKENYQRKADERCKELRAQIKSLEHRVEEAEKKRDDTFSNVLPDGIDLNKPCGKCAKEAANNAELTQHLEAHKATIENLKAKLAGLESELSSLRQSHDSLLHDLEVERVEKGELVAAAEQMLALCGEKMGEMQQQDEMRKSQMRPQGPPQSAEPMRSTGFLGGAPARPGSAMGGARPGSAMGERLGAMGGIDKKPSAAAKPSGLRAPGGFGFQGGSSAASGLNRSTSGSKSRLMSNIERMGGRGHE